MISHKKINRRWTASSAVRNTETKSYFVYLHKRNLQSAGEKTKQVSIPIVFEIILCLSIIAVMLYAFFCIYIAKLLCEEYLSRSPAQETNQESHDLNDISSVRLNN